LKALLSILFLYVFVFSSGNNQKLFCQYPHFNQISVENGLPTNEIYSILQDKDQYIWIGSDAGVFRYNGLNFEYFTHKDLLARSATGLVQSKSGKIFGYNFKGQIFYIDINGLHVLNDWRFSVNGLALDNNNRIWISSQQGSYSIDDENLSIHKHISSLHKYTNDNEVFTSCVRRDNDGTIFYQNETSIIEISQNGVVSSSEIHPDFKASPILISNSTTDPWLFGLTNVMVFRKREDKWVRYTDKRLLELLKGRKPNTAIEIDDNLWINTHTGVIRFSLLTGDAELFYPSIAFSGCLKDKEGNYWFTTLHHGLLKMASIEIKSWNKQTDLINIDQLSHVAASGNSIFTATTGGQLMSLLGSKKSISLPKHDIQADLGMLYYDTIDDCLYFNKLSYVFQLKNGNITRVNNLARSIKSMIHTCHGYFLLSSQGIYFIDNIKNDLLSENRIADGWYREICTSPSNDAYYVASNDGLLLLSFVDGGWQFTQTYLPGKQILSVTYDSASKNVYFLTFDGEVHQIDKNKLHTIIDTNLGEFRSTYLLAYNNQLYLSTIQGILEIDLSNKKRRLMSTYDGLPSNNIRHLTIRNDTCWAASGKGLICIPLNSFNKKNLRGVLHEREVRINNKIVPVASNLTIYHNDVLTIYVDGISYSSNVDYQLAYKIIGHTNGWIHVPGVIGKLEIPRLPSGSIHIAVKLIDHNGLDSLNTLHYQFKVVPPYWLSWWFFLLVITFVGLIAYIIFRWRLNVIRKKQQQALQQLKLENELRLTQQNALKAQMNPHFLFNVLNSIKAYIYENDKRNATRYLSDFSNLVRKVLDLSSQPKVSLEEELDILKLYIDLEAMLLQSDFERSISVDENVDTTSLYIPALLIQPFVENSFKHGLRHKTGKKIVQIHISYSDNDNLLLIRISDNGIGRVASAKINTNVNKVHESFATGAMEKRIALLNHDNEGIVGVEIIDNFGEDGTPSGTTVNIRIYV
jgi:ligand-binding sensor domain-containing protein